MSYRFLCESDEGVCLSDRSALLEQRELDPDQLPARLPGYVPPTVKRSITHSKKKSTYVILYLILRLACAVMEVLWFSNPLADSQH
jgi:hypothetical protein